MSGRVKPWLILGLIFVAGIVTGIALTVEMRSEWLRPPGAKQMQHHWMEHLTERLNLTADQQAKIQSILEAASEKIKGVHDDEVGRMGAIFKSTDDQIAPLLTPDQQAKFTALQAERQHDFARHLHHGWDGGGPPGGPPPGH